MKIKDMYNKNRPVISFEVFPPNTNHSIETIYDTIHDLATFNPDFVSVTYGAGGSTRGKTVEIASLIKNKYNIESLAHLTCVGASKSEIDSIIKEYQSNNIENILSLRGDFPKDMDEKDKHNGDFTYASDLTAYLKKNDFCVAGAYYPETHYENNDLMDLFNLKKKVDAGTDFLISQIFFDNELLYKFKDKTDKIGINVPFSAGIIPVTNAKQIKRITSLCGCSLPPKFQRILEKYADKPEALTEAGIAYAIEQIIDLISWGIDGIHLYTMNKVDTTKKIMDSISHIRDLSK
ncbi:MAG: methylenetetrahydrofolate reductase [NAD(P)H] [Fusobacteriaceae bacterium]|nr:methylenetetrahydrofolate reductase [NAD(P)H] [Fusobacteriaceae bacterium]